jgi:hypothetical protein
MIDSSGLPSEVVMSDARMIHLRRSPKDVAPAEATQAVGTLLRYAGRKLWDHVRHSYVWIGLCAYLAYGLYLKELDQSQVAAKPVADTEAIVGTWYLSEPQYTLLQFLPDGTVVSRTSRKETKGTYQVGESRIAMRFATEPLFWERSVKRPNGLPDRFAISGNELTLFATAGGDIATAQVYRFKRLDEQAPADDMALSMVTQ